jgi:ribosomal protein S27E
MPTPPSAALDCPRCATPLVTLSGGAAVGSLSIQCTRCGHWIRLDGSDGGAGAGPAFGPGRGGGAVAPRLLGGAFEVIGLVAAGVGALALAGLGVAQGMFRTMLGELGGEPPGLTAFVLSTRLPWVLAAITLALGAAALVVRLRGGAGSRWLLGAALGVVLVGAPVCIVSLYLPILTMAERIK